MKKIIRFGVVMFLISVVLLGCQQQDNKQEVKEEIKEEIKEIILVRYTIISMCFHVLKIVFIYFQPHYSSYWANLLTKKDTRNECLLWSIDLLMPTRTLPQSFSWLHRTYTIMSLRAYLPSFELPRWTVTLYTYILTKSHYLVNFLLI